MSIITAALYGIGESLYWKSGRKEIFAIVDDHYDGKEWIYTILLSDGHLQTVRQTILIRSAERVA